MGGVWDLGAQGMTPAKQEMNLVCPFRSGRAPHAFSSCQDFLENKMENSIKYPTHSQHTGSQEQTKRSSDVT